MIELVYSGSGLATEISKHVDMVRQSQNIIVTELVIAKATFRKMLEDLPTVRTSARGPSTFMGMNVRYDQMMPKGYVAFVDQDGKVLGVIKVAQQ